MIANIARYHRGSLPKERHPDYAALDPEAPPDDPLWAALAALAGSLPATGTPPSPVRFRWPPGWLRRAGLDRAPPPEVLPAAAAALAGEALARAGAIGNIELRQSPGRHPFAEFLRQAIPSGWIFLCRLDMAGVGVGVVPVADQEIPRLSSCAKLLD